MTEAEWTACQDPEPLLATVAPTAALAALRKLACACCRRVLGRFPDDWASQVFREETGSPGGCISPNDWPGPLLQEVGYVGWRTASAARDCCCEDIRASVANCLNNAVEALGFRWNNSEQAKAVKAEKAAMAELIREMFPFAGDSA